MKSVIALPILIASAAMLFGETQPTEGSLRRLTHSQYNNTVRDLLGRQHAPG